MTLLTNHHGIDPAIVRAIENDPYEHGGDVSVSGLLLPPQMAALRHQHRDELTEDASERLWALLGQAMHVVLERGAHDNELSEERLNAEVAGWTVAGKPDLWREAGGGELVDYKVTSVYSFLLGDKPEWEMQLNLYAALYRRHGFPVTKLTIAAILRDWVKTRTLTDGDYPRIPFQSVAVRVWPAEEAERVLEERVALHQAARVGEYGPCTDAERWYRGDRWAVMKRGRKSAVRVLDTEAAAQAVLESQQRTAKPGDSFYMEQRPGANTRCESYCIVAQWCGQARSLGVGKSPLERQLEESVSALGGEE